MHNVVTYLARLLRSRRSAQSVVEYSMDATVAFVLVVAGARVLSLGEADNVLEGGTIPGGNSPLNPTPVATPGPLVHPTRLDIVSCSANAAPPTLMPARTTSRSVTRSSARRG